VTRVRNGLVLVLAAGSLSGCEIDRVEWESAGFPVEEVARTLEEEHGAGDAAVRCIKREVGGAVWECHAVAAEREFECEVKVGPREAIRKLECEARDEAPREAAA
jgi:hypothetical protein